MRGSPLRHILALLACDPGPSPNGAAIACEGTGGVHGEVSFDADRVLCVELSMHPDDFWAMAAQQRWGEDEEELWAGTMEHILSDCTEPFPSSYTWFEADVRIDGESLERVGVRKKGFVGSALDGAESRPSLKIKTDTWVEGQSFGDTERITLNNNLTDASRMHTCLSYGVFADAGYPAPRCNVAGVVVNGQPLGAYAHVEAVKKGFLARAFGDDSGHLYEGIIADFTADHLAGTPESLGRWEAKTDQTDPTGEPLWAVAEALQAPDEELEAALSEVVDLDRFFTFWALETLLAHTDGYNAGTNNFYVYFDPSDGGRATFIPWGMDDAMQQGAAFDNPAWMHDLFTLSELARRLSRHPELSARFTDELARLMDEVWDERALLDRIDGTAALVRTVEDRDSYDDSTETLQAWVRGRRGQIEHLLAEGTPVGSERPGDCWSRLNPDEAIAGTRELATIAYACAASPRRGWMAPLALLGLGLWVRRRSSTVR